MRMSMFLRCLTLWLATALLGGCAVTRTVDSSVQSYSSLAALPAPPSYRLELLPSQQAQSDAYAPIVPLVHAALAHAGLTRDDAAPRLIAQFDVRTGTSYADGPWYPWGAWGDFGWGGRRGGLRAGMMLRDMPPLLYRHEVRLVLRDATTQKTVYETSASNEDVWSEVPRVFGVLFDAALTGFPTPPTGPREIRLPLAPPATP